MGRPIAFVTLVTCAFALAACASGEESGPTSVADSASPRAGDAAPPVVRDADVSSAASSAPTSAPRPTVDNYQVTGAAYVDGARESLASADVPVYIDADRLSAGMVDGRAARGHQR